MLFGMDEKHESCFLKIIIVLELCYLEWMQNELAIVNTIKSVL